MSIESEIQTDVDALRGRFTDTKSLYREVCALLFFRYGITPTTNKLYQFVRKGSMSAPADALTQFWDELRSKARVEIDHPDLPPELKAIAAEAIASIWRQASAGARAELAELRIELRADVERAEAESNESHEAAEASRLEVINLEQDLHEATEASRSKTVEVEAERRAHAASAARMQELQRLVDELRAEQTRQREGFSADLAKSRDAVEAANARADAADRRALLDIDQERQARARAEKSLETFRSQSSQAEERLRSETQTMTEKNARLSAKADAFEAANRELRSQVDRAAETMDALRGQLRTAENEAARAKTEAETLQGVLNRLSTSSPPTGASRSPKSRKG